MEDHRTLQMIEWLDEQRRQDKQTIATLLERAAQQQETVDLLQRRLNALESDQSVIRSQFMPTAHEADLIETMRREMQTLIEQVEVKRLTAERESERRTEIARETAARPIREMAEKLMRLERQTTELPAINSETDRLAGTVATVQQRVEDLHKRMEDPERRILQIDEGRRQDARRLSELESELPEVRKQIDTIKPKLTLLEDLALRSERRIADIQTGDRDRREQMQAFIDQQTLVQQQQAQQVNDLVKRAADQEALMQRNTERFETWAEAYREMKRIIDDFNRIADRLEYRINEVSEMQRLSEERFRQEWNDWRGEDQKRWKLQTAAQDDIWRSHDKDFERFIARVTEVADQIPPLTDSLARLWNLERERARLYRDRYQAMMLEYDSPVNNTSSQPAVPSSSLATGNGIIGGANGNSATNAANVRGTSLNPPVNGQPSPSTSQSIPAVPSSTSTGVYAPYRPNGNGSGDR